MMSSIEDSVPFYDAPCLIIANPCWLSAPEPLTSAVLAEIHEEWLTGRQYLNLADWSTTEKPASQSNYRKSGA